MVEHLLYHRAKRQIELGFTQPNANALGSEFGTVRYRQLPGFRDKRDYVTHLATVAKCVRALLSSRISPVEFSRHLCKLLLIIMAVGITTEESRAGE